VATRLPSQPSATSGMLKLPSLAAFADSPWVRTSAPATGAPAASTARPITRVLCVGHGGVATAQPKRVTTGPLLEAIGPKPARLATVASPSRSKPAPDAPVIHSST